MRILWVKADKLLPVHSGGSIRSYNLLRQLAADHDLTYLSYYDGESDRDYEDELRRQFPGAVGICTGKAELTGIRRGWDYLGHLHQRAPYAVSRFACAKVRETLLRWYEERRFDVAICDFLDAAVNFPKRLSIPTVLFQHNVEHEIWRRHAATESHPVKRQIYGLEFRKMLQYEREALKRFHYVIAVSEHDRALMSRWVDGARITVVPTGVDLTEFHVSSKPVPGRPLVVFVGAMDWEPNIDGAEYFCGEIWPKLRAKVPDAVFRLVGRNPDRRIKALASDSVEVTGRVPSVVEHLWEAAVVVVPLRIGGGTRLKIYEAMAAGRAVVSTTIGAEGLDVKHGSDIMLSDDANSFADSVCRVLKDPVLRHRYEEAAARSAGRHDWPAIGRRFADVLEAVSKNSTEVLFGEQGSLPLGLAHADGAGRRSGL
jgi:glycosyltransferase involved in cell wall biosynthesis